VLLALTAASVDAPAQEPGPGDPTTVFASGFTAPCRMEFDSEGDLFVKDGAVIYRVAPDGSSTVFTDEVPDGRGFTFDAFGDMIVPSPGNSTIHKVSPAAEVTDFISVFNARRVRTGPDGSLWFAAIDSIHHYDAMGRHLESVDVMSQGGAAFGLRFSPSGELFFSSWGGYWKLVDGVVVPVLTEVLPRGGAPTFDELGNIYTGHESVTEGDPHRVILYDSDMSVLDDAFVTDVEPPCGIQFGRETDGSTNARLFIAQRDGTIVEANPAGIAAPGFPVVGLALNEIDEEDCADAVVGVPASVSEDESTFLDAIGNNNGSYDAGDFRAYLVRTGVVDGS
jgi:hypothetical protein